MTHSPCKEANARRLNPRIHAMFTNTHCGHRGEGRRSNRFYQKDNAPMASSPYSIESDPQSFGMCCLNEISKFQIVLCSSDFSEVMLEPRSGPSLDREAATLSMKAGMHTCTTFQSLCLYHQFMFHFKAAMNRYANLHWKETTPEPTHFSLHRFE